MSFVVIARLLTCLEDGARGEPDRCMSPPALQRVAWNLTQKVRAVGLYFDVSSAVSMIAKVPEVNHDQSWRQASMALSFPLFVPSPSITRQHCRFTARASKCIFSWKLTTWDK